MADTTRVWTKEEIKELLQKSDKMVERSLLKMYERQTADEQQAGQTREYNQIGFNGCDAEFLSSVAEWVKKGNKITEKQMTYVRKKLLKYSRQIAEIANAA